MDEIIWTVIGGIAACLTTFGFVPQILKMWRGKSVGDVSVITFYQFTAGVTLWAIYGYSRQDPIIISANVVALATLIVALTLYYRYKTGPLQRLMLLTLRTAQEIGSDATIAVRRSSYGLIKEVAEAGGDMVAITKAVVEGAIAGAKSTRLRPEFVTSAAAAGAVEAAGEVSEEAEQTVKDAVSDILAGMETEEEPD